MISQLPMNIPAVARWYDAVDRHRDRCKNTLECAGCRRLGEKMRELRVKHADKLVSA